MATRDVVNLDFLQRLPIEFRVPTALLASFFAPVQRRARERRRSMIDDLQRAFQLRLQEARRFDENVRQFGRRARRDVQQGFQSEQGRLLSQGVASGRLGQFLTSGQARLRREQSEALSTIGEQQARLRLQRPSLVPIQQALAAARGSPPVERRAQFPALLAALFGNIQPNSPAGNFFGAAGGGFLGNLLGNLIPGGGGRQQQNLPIFRNFNPGQPIG